MFLKKKEVQISGESVVLHELSALQRADYFDFLALKEKESSNLEGIEFAAKSMRQIAESNVWLVSRSLWHSDRDREVEEVYEEVALTWSSSALEEAVSVISEISGMKGDAQESSAEGEETNEQDSMGK
ncbi:phage tail assembly chaperone G [Providencia rettgeri]|uniref:phage tail assembly chaperone G n=1 Tax=Providencia rettgeri TaxID=587 RepID=UPI0015EBD228|nr:phage minor tail protein G [Providencia rettgeri]QLR06004.1 phage minor tail protein G [Providencia rettgeri]